MGRPNRGVGSTGAKKGNHTGGKSKYGNGGCGHIRIVKK